MPRRCSCSRGVSRDQGIDDPLSRLGIVGIGSRDLHHTLADRVLVGAFALVVGAFPLRKIHEIGRAAQKLSAHFLQRRPGRASFGLGQATQKGAILAKKGAAVP